MDLYLTNIKMAVILFPFIAMLLTVPYMLYTYRRYGSISWLRSGILASFLFYLLCAYFLVVFPLPSREAVAALTTPRAQLIPLQFIVDIVRKSVFDIARPATYLAALRQPLIYEPLFNLFLTLPFGVYLSYYFRNDLKKTVFFTFLLSLFFELTQLSGLYGIYPRPYRLFDVDDLLLNTLGGLLGFVIGSRLTALLPSRQRMDAASRKRSEKVSFTRRAMAAFVDYFLLSILLILPGSFLPIPDEITFAIFYFAYFVGIPLLWHGRTPGKALVRIRVAAVPADASPFWTHLVLKYGLLYLLYCLFRLSNLNFANAGAGYDLFVLAFYLLTMLLCFIDWLRSFRHGKRLWYERWSGTQNQSTLPVEGSAAQSVTPAQ